jgi:hypothetical protein
MAKLDDPLRSRVWLSEENTAVVRRISADEDRTVQAVVNRLLTENLCKRTNNHSAKKKKP